MGLLGNLLAASSPTPAVAGHGPDVTDLASQGFWNLVGTITPVA